MPLRLTPALIPLLLLAACADGAYPSLAPRPDELKQQAPAAPSAPPTVEPADPALAVRLRALIEQAQQGEAAFRASLGAVEAKVAAAGGSGSESWIEAQEAVSQLEGERAPTMVALAELDTIAREKIEAAPSGAQADLAAIDAAAVAIRALADAQDAAVAELANALPSI